MSYDTCLQAIHAAFATVTTPRAIAVLLDYEPTAAQDYPLMYSLLESFERVRSGQVLAVRWRTMHRLVLRWQDSEQCEAELRAFVDSIPAVIDADGHLGGALGAGYAHIESGDTGWSEIGQTEVRFVDFTSLIVEK